MMVQLRNSIVLLAAMACFVDSVHHPEGSFTGPVLSGMLGFILLLKGLTATPRPAGAVLSGCILAALSVGSDQGFLNDNSLWYIGLFILAGAGFGFWERIEKFWK
jgi:Na+/H+-translocating membrane pyrophosphatase